MLEPHYRNVTLTKAPFVVSRTGWGEFTAQIKIYMTFSSRAQVLTHWLRLVEYTDKNDETSAYRYVPFVRYEDYNEIVIVNPTEEQQRAMQTETTEPEPEFEQFNAIREQTIKSLLQAKQVIATRFAVISRFSCFKHESKETDPALSGERRMKDAETKRNRFASTFARLELFFFCSPRLRS